VLSSDGEEQGSRGKRLRGEVGGVGGGEKEKERRIIS